MSAFWGSNQHVRDIQSSRLSLISTVNIWFHWIPNLNRWFRGVFIVKVTQVKHQVQCWYKCKCKVLVFRACVCMITRVIACPSVEKLLQWLGKKRKTYTSAWVCQNSEMGSGSRVRVLLYVARARLSSWLTWMILMGLFGALSLLLRVVKASKTWPLESLVLGYFWGFVN